MRSSCLSSVLLIGLTVAAPSCLSPSDDGPQEAESDLAGASEDSRSADGAGAASDGGALADLGATPVDLAVPVPPTLPDARIPESDGPDVAAQSDAHATAPMRMATDLRTQRTTAHARRIQANGTPTKMA